VLPKKTCLFFLSFVFVLLATNRITGDRLCFIPLRAAAIVGNKQNNTRQAMGRTRPVVDGSPQHFVSVA
jgi:hypothetical protein